MKLWTINRVLRRLGLVLVIEFDLEPAAAPEATRLWIERASTYDRRRVVPRR